MQRVEEEGREGERKRGGEREIERKRKKKEEFFLFLFLLHGIWSSLLKLLAIKLHSVLEQCIGCQHGP